MVRRKKTRGLAWLMILSLAFTMCASLLPTSFARPNGEKSSSRRTRSGGTANYPVLSRYATDLTELALQRKLRTTAVNSASVDETIEILSGIRNPVLLENPHINAREIAEAVAKRIVAGKVPTALLSKRLFSVNVDEFFAGLKTSDEVDARLKTLVDEASSGDGEVILFLDQLYQFVGARASQFGSGYLKAALDRHNVRVIGATTVSAYGEYIARDASSRRLFKLIVNNDGAEDVAELGDEAQSESSVDFEGDKVSPDLRELIQRSASERVKVILQAENISGSKLRNLLKRHNVEIKERFQELGSLALELPVSAVEELAASNLTSYISLDRDVRSLQLLGIDLLGADGGVGHLENTTGALEMRAQSGNSGIDGDSIGIAVIDSGLFRDHDVMDRIVYEKDFTGDGKGTLDKFGHGTHVTGLITTKNDSQLLGNDGYTRYKGIAPDANIINLRVLNGVGTGSVSTLIKALNWILEPVNPLYPSGDKNNKKYNIRVVNMSLGTYAIDSYKNDPLCRAARRLVDAGIVVVAAAGNNGKDSSGQKLYGRIHSPGNEPSVITVGATNTYGTDGRNDDTITTYSSRGPTRSYTTEANGFKRFDNLIKPDLVAPGNKLIAAEAATKERINGRDEIVPNYLLANNPELRAVNDSDYRRRLMRLSGTSMAAPIVSGAAALLLQANPKLTPNMVKMILMYTAQPIPGANMLEQGTGQLNIEGAVRVAKQIRTDLNWATTPVGTRMLKTTTLPTPKSTIANQKVNWAQGILVNYTYATGTNLIYKYQKIYGMGVVLGDAVVLGDGILISETQLIGDGIVLGDGILISSGVVLCDGTLLLPSHALFGDGILVADGVVLADGILISDGIVLGDGVVLCDGGRLTSDGVVLADGDVSGEISVAAMSVLVHGDDGPEMH
jgi:serine protease AprX